MIVVLVRSGYTLPYCLFVCLFVVVSYFASVTMVPASVDIGTSPPNSTSCACCTSITCRPWAMRPVKPSATAGKSSRTAAGTAPFRGGTPCLRELTLVSELQSVICPAFNYFTPKLKKYILPTFLKRNVWSEVVRSGSKIIFHLSKLWKAKFFILCDVIFLVRPQGKFETDHSWEWKG